MAIIVPYSDDILRKRLAKILPEPLYHRNLLELNDLSGIARYIQKTMLRDLDALPTVLGT